MDHIETDNQPASDNPTSDARREANQANAQHSTGPRTEEGKAASSQNARKHGLCAKEVILQPHEEEEFGELLQEHLTTIQPEGVMEHTLLDEMVAATWNLRRIRRMEADLCRGLDPLAALDNEELQKKLDRLARYHGRMERTLARATKQLATLQTERAHRQIMMHKKTTVLSPLVSSVILQRVLNNKPRGRSFPDQRPMPSYS